MTRKEQDKQEAISALRELCPPGTTVYTALKHVSRSGMSRSISCYVIRNNKPRWIDSLVCKATGYTFDAQREAVKVGGCGMDMGFAIVYDLAHTLWGKQFACIGDGCPSNDHSNGDRDYTPHAHSDGGYALKQRWI